jgi:hypothetical protein
MSPGVPKHLLYPQGHPELDVLDMGYRPNPAGVDYFTRQLSHPGPLALAAPGMMGDGQTGDILPYLAWYEVELLNDDGTVWKAKGAEPPYIPQVGNNCTSEGRMHCQDLLQVMDIADQVPDAQGNVPVFHRTCVEFSYASSLAAANMRGDQGCYGAATATAAYKTGEITYKDAGEPYQETRSRLVSWANNPTSVVAKYQSVASARRMGSEPVKITTTSEARAWLANRGLITIASDVGFNVPRDSNGICRRAGSWNHQMALWGAIDSDGHDTFVIVQSWGPGQPTGAQPFKIPSFCFRALASDIQAILDQGDTWGYRLFPGYERAALPDRWTSKGWGL